MSLLFTPPRRIIEAGSVGSVQQLDSDDHLYRGLGTAPRDLPGQTLQKAQELSIALYRANPLANRIINIYRSFLSGKGFGIGATNPEVDAVVQDYWRSPRNRLDRNHSNYTRDFLLMGESHLPAAFDEAGNTTIGFIDPTTVLRVHREPTNNMLLTEIVVRKPDSIEEQSLQIMKVSTDPLDPGAGLWTGETHTWLADRIAASTRGTPFLLPALDWLDAYDQVLWEMLERTKAMRAHFWSVKVVGGQREVDEAKALFGTTTPKTGSVRYSTDAMEIAAVAPQLGTMEDVQAARYHLRHIASGGGLAPHWLGDPEDANRSTAESMDIPVLRSLADMQDEWVANTREMLEVAVDAKVRARMLPAILPAVDERGLVIEGSEKPAREHVRIEVPEIEADKVVAAAAALASTAQAFVQLDMLGAIGKQTMSKIVRQLLPALGIPADELPDEDDEPEKDAKVLESYRRYADAVTV
jgi:hypothetical protein